MKEIPAPPPVLYVKGTLKKEDILSISLVGTRKPSEYGRSMTRRLAKELSGLGMTIISGLAWGIDSEAHRATLDANGRTIAVMGTGLLYVYPADNKKLAEEIVEKGAILSEFSMMVRPEKKNFPIRNLEIRD